MEKGFGLIIITLILVCGSVIIFDKYVNVNNAKYGLEECRVDATVIWVKDCKSILEAKARLR